MRQQRRPYRAMALYTAILSQLAGSMLVGLFTGRWLDHKWDTEPLFLIIGLLIGLATGIYAMLRTVNQFYSGD
ncbi:AtpZ/AtpI family protein [Jeotgalibacillus soli]|uniref:ATP synthase protein I n=1 Tax=Jeotgalibacillus soli TaxID=889306 RepID=A0A0C2VZF1_9BACL|nr:AtpZ/AtpI family protein [Jeotgalibacillus soli]KIL49766.1 hypothetical protein KP78_12340 [Jeotgalibacillus soli]